MGNHCVINEAYPTLPDWSFFYKMLPFKLSNPSFHPHSFTIPPISLPFQLPKSLPLPTNHCSPTILQSPKSYHLLVGVAVVGVFSVTKYFYILFFSNSKVCVSNFYSFILHLYLLISISLVVCDMFVSSIKDSI